MSAADHIRRQHNRQKGECTWCGKPVGKRRRHRSPQRTLEFAKPQEQRTT